MARQNPPTAKGFAFLAVEDAGGMVNAGVASDIYTRDRVALQGAVVLIDGVLQRDHGDITVIAKSIGSV